VAEILTPPDEEGDRRIGMRPGGGAGWVTVVVLVFPAVQ